MLRPSSIPTSSSRPPRMGTMQRIPPLVLRLLLAIRPRATAERRSPRQRHLAKQTRLARVLKTPLLMAKTLRLKGPVPYKTSLPLSSRRQSLRRQQGITKSRTKRWRMGPKGEPQSQLILLEGPQPEILPSLIIVTCLLIHIPSSLSSNLIILPCLVWKVVGIVSLCLC